MKTLIAVLCIMGLLSALSWDKYVKMPLEEKYILQYERLNEIANGSRAVPGITPLQATIWSSDLQRPITIFATSYPSEYKRASESVKEIIKEKPAILPNQTETKFIKVGGRYVSESICKATPSLCVENKSVSPAPKPVVYKRTPEQCLSARQKDWEVYCWQSYPDIACDGVNDENKAMILDNLAKSYYSNQGICLRGE